MKQKAKEQRLKIILKYTCGVCDCFDDKNVNLDDSKFKCTACGHEEHVDLNKAKVMKKFAKILQDKRVNDKFAQMKGPGETANGCSVNPKRILDKNNDSKDLRLGDRIIHHTKHKRKCPKKMWEED